MNATDGQAAATPGVVPVLSALHGSTNMHQALFAHGWKIGQDGLPCNQGELAYTLLTFGYVFLRVLRTLGLVLNGSDEEAFLHTWKVVAHVLGIKRELMPSKLDEAKAMFNEMQAQGLADNTLPDDTDPRPKLGQALMKTMEDVIPWRIVKPFPTLFTRYLCGAVTAKVIGIDGRVSWFSQMLFATLMSTIRVIDATVRLVFSEFSISRFISGVIGSQYVWTNNFGVEHHMSGISSAMAIGGTILFLEESLREQGKGPWFPRIMKGGALLALLLGLAYSSDLIDARALSIIITVFGPMPSPICMPRFIERVRRGEAVGIHLLLAWTAYMIAVIVITAVIRGYAPVNFWTLHSFQFGATFDMLAVMYVLTLRTPAWSATSCARSPTLTRSPACPTGAV